VTSPVFCAVTPRSRTSSDHALEPLAAVARPDHDRIALDIKQDGVAGDASACVILGRSRFFPELQRPLSFAEPKVIRP
jgi:hypothetical protein